jgi:fructose-bisphosphate aldolase class 1
MSKIDGKLTNNNNSSKEMRQIELKLKKKEQLKIKEAILNDSTSEKKVIR